jgi:predicted enzyme related to lactoylglutathione lyase
MPTEGGGTYKVAKAGDRPVAGLCPSNLGAQPTRRWLSYVEVPDVDRACGLALHMRGKVVTPPTDIPGIGRFAIIADPAGATIAPFKSSRPPAPESDAMPQVGEFCWYQLQTPDPKAVAPFYAELFGWSITEQAGPLGPYLRCNRGDRETAGIVRSPAGSGTSEWLCFVVVGDVDKATQIGATNAATVRVGPTDLAAMGRMSVLADPFGAPIVLFKWSGLPQG